MIPINQAVEIFMAPVGKARPRVTRNGTYMPDAYREWKRDFGLECRVLVPMAGRFGIAVKVLTRSGKMGPDLDNVLGAILDALQDCGVIQNDRDCVYLSAGIEKVFEKNEPSIRVRIYQMPPPLGVGSSHETK